MFIINHDDIYSTSNCWFCLQTSDISIAYQLLCGRHIRCLFIIYVIHFGADISMFELSEWMPLGLCMLFCMWYDINLINKNIFHIHCWNYLWGICFFRINADVLPSGRAVRDVHDVLKLSFVIWWGAFSRKIFYFTTNIKFVNSLRLKTDLNTTCIGSFGDTLMDYGCKVKLCSSAAKEDKSCIFFYVSNCFYNNNKFCKWDTLVEQW